MSEEIYRKRLSSYANGVTLWNPEPNENLPEEVRIGDLLQFTRVGGVDSDPKFNACLRSLRPTNGDGVPDRVQQVQLGPRDIIKVAHLNLLPSVISGRYRRDISIHGRL